MMIRFHKFFKVNTPANAEKLATMIRERDGAEIEVDECSIYFPNKLTFDHAVYHYKSKLPLGVVFIFDLNTITLSKKFWVGQKVRIARSNAEGYYDHKGTVVMIEDSGIVQVKWRGDTILCHPEHLAFCDTCKGSERVPNPEVNHSHRARRYIRCPMCK
jgi:hypothetical protein